MNKPPSDPDLLRDLEAFKALHQPKAEEPQKPASEETAVKMHAVQLAMQELTKLEERRTELLQRITTVIQQRKEQIKVLLELHSRLQHPELFRRRKTCRMNKYYDHTIYHYQWFDGQDNCWRTTAEAELCSFGRCEVNSDIANQELYQERLRVWEILQNEFGTMRYATSIESDQQFLREVEASIRNYRSFIESIVESRFEELSKQHEHQIAPDPQIQRPIFTANDPRSEEEKVIDKQKVIEALLSKQLPKYLFKRKRNGNVLLSDNERPIIDWPVPEEFESIAQTLSPIHQRDRDICMALVPNISPHDLVRRTNVIMNVVDRGFLVEAYSQNTKVESALLFAAPPEFHADEEIVLLAISHDDNAICYAAESLKASIPFARKLLQQHGRNSLFLYELHESVFGDPEILKLAGFSTIIEYYEWKHETEVRGPPLDGKYWIIEPIE